MKRYQWFLVTDTGKKEKSEYKIPLFPNVISR